MTSRCSPLKPKKVASNPPHGKREKEKRKSESSSMQPSKERNRGAIYPERPTLKSDYIYAKKKKIKNRCCQRGVMKSRPKSQERGGKGGDLDLIPLSRNEQGQ